MRIIKNSQKSDIKNKRYDAKNFIDYPFIETLISNSNKCHYCQVEMQFLDFNDTLCTIERLDNNIGHVKVNCVIACKKCNIKRVGQSQRTNKKNCAECLSELCECGEK
jgi:hypothetical protein